MSKYAIKNLRIRPVVPRNTENTEPYILKQKQPDILWLFESVFIR